MDGASLSAMARVAANCAPDLDADMIGSILEWTMDRFQDALLTEELDPGLFRKQGSVPEKKEARIEQFTELLRRAIGSEKAQNRGKKA